MNSDSSEGSGRLVTSRDDGFALAPFPLPLSSLSTLLAFLPPFSLASSLSRPSIFTEPADVGLTTSGGLRERQNRAGLTTRRECFGLVTLTGEVDLPREEAPDESRLLSLFWDE